MLTGAGGSATLLVGDGGALVVGLGLLLLGAAAGVLVLLGWAAHSSSTIASNRLRLLTQPVERSTTRFLAFDNGFARFPGVKLMDQSSSCIRSAAWPALDADGPIDDATSLPHASE